MTGVNHLHQLKIPDGQTQPSTFPHGVAKGRNHRIADSLLRAGRGMSSESSWRALGVRVLSARSLSVGYTLMTTLSFRPKPARGEVTLAFDGHGRTEWDQCHEC